LLLGTYRDTDTPPDGVLARWLEAQRRDEVLARLPVRGLDEPSVAALVESWVDDRRRVSPGAFTRARRETRCSSRRF